jgi:hypothetical protein
MAPTKVPTESIRDDMGVRADVQGTGQDGATARPSRP